MRRTNGSDKSKDGRSALEDVSPALEVGDPATPKEDHHDTDPIHPPKTEQGNDDDDDSSPTQQNQTNNKRPPPQTAFVIFLFGLIFLLIVLRRHQQQRNNNNNNNNNDTSFVLPLQSWVQQLNDFWVFNNESSSSLQSSLQYSTQERQRPGYQLAQQGAKPKYPIVIIPGFVTSGLEVWGGHECAKKFFRQRIWTALTAVRQFLADRECWRQHMTLDPVTGGDPPGIRLRAASGFQAVDYFMANYWVFGKLIENLADVGYTPSEMVVEPYDWRLAFPLLESRDGYFSRVKGQIEVLHETTGEKVVLISHSMGVLVVHYFLSWVVSPRGGKGGANWVDKHVHAFVNLAGAHLGVPKALTAILSGEMSDTAALMNPLAAAVEQYFGRQVRRDMWNTWGAIWAMFPKGGDAIWSVGADMCPDDDLTGLKSTSNGNATSLPTTDPFCPIRSEKRSPLLAFAESNSACSARSEVAPEPANTEKTAQQRQSCSVYGSDDPNIPEFVMQQDYTVKPVMDHVQQFGLAHANLANAEMFSFHGKKPRRDDPKAWHDPTQTPLPNAPNMKMYCLYGTGKPTERAYYYKLNLNHNNDNNEAATGTARRAPKNVSSSSSSSLLDDPPVILDSTINLPHQNVERGVRYTDGDGSVPLLALGYLCADAYQRSNSGLNPAKMAVYTREYPHRQQADSFVLDDPMRSGPHSGEHVDFLGNVDMTEDLLRIVTGFGEENVNENKISSDILDVADKINRKKGLVRRGVGGTFDV